MISEEGIKALVLEKIAGSDFFLVNVKVSTSNKIVILIDGLKGIGIDDCVSISRHVESNLDREQHDFELEVSSPGLSSPFLVLEQYQKYLGKEVEVQTEDGKKVKGVLVRVDSLGIVLKSQEKVKLEGKKKKELVTTEKPFYFEKEDKAQKIKSTKIVISFK